MPLRSHRCRWVPSTSVAGVFWVCVMVATLCAKTGVSALFESAGTATVSYTGFTSDYMRLKTASEMTWSGSADGCANYGVGWYMAGIYNATGNAAVYGLLNGSKAFIGGITPTGFNMDQRYFMWYGGRYRGKGISVGLSPSTCLQSYCNYYPGQPSGANEQLLQMYDTTGGWNDINLAWTGPNHACTGSECNAVICERSLCSISADCIASGTLSVSNSYSPDCTCTCKAGYRGAKCQMVSDEVSVGGTTYSGYCEKDTLNTATAQARCVALGDGWQLASIPSPEADAAIRGLSSWNMWTGGAYNSAANSWGWQYGRMAGKAFSSGSTCLAGVHCNWNPGEPNRADCGDGSPLEESVIVMGTEWSSTQKWDDMWTNGCSFRDTFSVYCYVCERSPCDINVDCVAANTVTMNGSYYPGCTCTCKHGFRGPKCQSTKTASQGLHHIADLRNQFQPLHTHRITVRNPPNVAVAINSVVCNLLEG